MRAVSFLKLAVPLVAVVLVGLGVAWAYGASGAAPVRDGSASPSSGGARSAAAPRPAEEAGRARSFAVEPFARGFNRPTYVGAAPGDRRGVWVLEQPGRVVRLDRGRRRTVLDLRSRVKLGSEQGLLGIAFHPDYAANRRLYLHFSDRRGDTRVAEFRARGDHRISARPARQLLFQRQPEENHNGGQLAFGPDGRLYLGLGDGGGAFDPNRTAQNPRSRLGKIIATRVNGRPRWKTVVSGLRNPWRFSFDAGLGDLWIADVGQDHYEEVNRIALEFDEPPKNAGWSVYEGLKRIREGRRRLDRRGELVWPVAGYTHSDGCSVTGGHVYAGTALPGLQRRYVYGDYCTGALWTLRGTARRRATDVRREAAQLPQLTHIGADADGELLFASGAGVLYRAVPAGAGR